VIRDSYPRPGYVFLWRARLRPCRGKGGRTGTGVEGRGVWDRRLWRRTLCPEKRSRCISRGKLGRHRLALFFRFFSYDLGFNIYGGPHWQRGLVIYLGVFGSWREFHTDPAEPWGKERSANRLGMISSGINQAEHSGWRDELRLVRGVCCGTGPDRSGCPPGRCFAARIPTNRDTFQGNPLWRPGLSREVGDLRAYARRHKGRSESQRKGLTRRRALDGLGPVRGTEK
jgi:hypothetical protein